MKLNIFKNLFGFFSFSSLKKFFLDKCSKHRNTTKAEQFERCILCGILTDIPISTPLEFRENYEVGCGQMCYDCHQMLQQDFNENTLSNEQIMLAVAKSIEESKE